MADKNDKFEHMTSTEMQVLSKAETKVDKEIKIEERKEPPTVRPNDALLDALNLLDQLEQQKTKLERREQVRGKVRVSERLADNIAKFGGSWTFITCFLAFMMGWMIINILWLTYRWDPYPFILLNLMLSTLAALQAPIILMSQNRQSDRDRRRDEIDFERDRLDLKVDTLAAKTIHEATVRITNIEQQIVEINKKLDRIAEKSNNGSKRRKRK